MLKKSLKNSYDTTPQEFYTQIIYMTITATKTVTVLTKTFCLIKTMDILCALIKNQGLPSPQHLMKYLPF